MAQNKIREALDRIEQGLANIETDEDWLKYLRFQAEFYKYSFGNALLIYLQNPEASYVMGYKAWNKIGRYVKKGSKGLAILICTQNPGHIDRTFRWNTWMLLCTLQGASILF